MTGKYNHLKFFKQTWPMARTVLAVIHEFWSKDLKHREK